MIDRLQSPAIYAPLDFTYTLPACEKNILPNGVPLYSVNHCPEPVLFLELVFPAGMWYEKKTGVAQATAALLKSGTANLNSFQINESFEQYGASVKSGAGSDWASLSVSCLSKQLEKVIPLFASLLQETLFPQHELDIYIRNAKERMSVQLKKSDFVANRLIDTYLFGESHPYGRFTHIEDLDKIQREDLLQHLQTYFGSGGCKIFMAGQFGDQEIKLVEQYFGQAAWFSHTITIPAYMLHRASEKKYRIAHDEHSVQGSIRLLRDFPEKEHPDFSGMIVLNTLFGGYFGSRLMSNIREDKGYTYGIHSYLYNNRHSGAYIITTEAGKTVCEATVEEVYKEMMLLQNEAVSNEELSLVKNYLLGNLLGDLDGAFQIIRRWKNLILNGFTEERFYQNIKMYKEIQPETLQALAKKYLRPEDFYELIVI